MTKTMCGTCRKATGYTLHSRVASHEIGNKEIIFREKYATCNECGSDVSVACIDVESEREFESVCNGLKGCGLL